MKRTLKTILSAAMILQFVQIPVLAQENAEPEILETIEDSQNTSIVAEEVNQTYTLEEEIGATIIPPADEADPIDTSKNGWIKVEDGDNIIWYYYVNGEKHTGWLVENGNVYYLDEETGAMYSNKRAYLDSYTGGTKSFFYFKTSGQMVRNTLVEFTGGRPGFRFYDANGLEYYGWVQLQGKWKYFRSEPDEALAIYHGKAYTGQVTLMNNPYGVREKCAFNDKGEWVKSGWVLMKNRWFYFWDKDITLNWKKIDNVWYYFYPDSIPDRGVMAADAKITLDGKSYYLSSSGAMISNAWRSDENGKWWYYNGSGEEVYGWFKWK
ncbi:MAG: hypothetical protein HUJ53_02805, partial [Holdemanella sp.]|nr:hypothetical protein [Holdemanella sp.]